jgi:predicted CXXCH cytochrome family protein
VRYAHGSVAVRPFHFAEATVSLLWFRLGVGFLVLTTGLAIGWWVLRTPDPPPDPAAEPLAEIHSPRLTSRDCAECHQSQYHTWYRTYHRTMTREATPEFVKGDFNNAVLNYHGLPTRMTREGNSFFMETVDPDWAALLARAGGQRERVPPPRFVKLKVDRLVGSHWLQECLHRTAAGQYVRLPVLYHIGEKRWVHTNGAFLAPDTDDFWARSRGANWNESCLYCHNTEPSKNPIPGPRGVRAYQTEVTELGIACAACHGPGIEHVRMNRNPDAPSVDPDVVHPARLSIPRRDDICARCHGALVPKVHMWDLRTHRDPFIPGQDLTLYNHHFRSEAEQLLLARGRPPHAAPPKPEPTDGRFWGDGTPLTTALEFNGMALSACYQNGRGRMSCLSCHTAHGGDPNHMLKPRMRTNEACYHCHADYRHRLAEHTRHPVDSPGSHCFNCHMPHVVYSLMSTHRSHRIQTPDLQSSLGTGKPHACNLCHLDKSLGWTRDQLSQWPNGKTTAAGTLSPDEEAIASAVLLLSQGDARTRVIVAGAFDHPAARQASGTDWIGSLLTRLIEDERYPAVRLLAHRALVSAHGQQLAEPFDYLAVPTERQKQLRVLRDRFDQTPVRRALPFVPLTPQGLPDEVVLKRLRAGRLDPDVTINE